MTDFQTFAVVATLVSVNLTLAAILYALLRIGNILRDK